MVIMKYSVGSVTDLNRPGPTITSEERVVHTMVSYKPLGNNSQRVFQGIVVLDANDVNVLVDVGWDESLSTQTLNRLIEAIPRIDVILLTHGAVGHTGAFAYLRHKFPEFRAIPAYATLPVIRMSQMMTLDIYRSAGLCGAFDNDDAISSKEIESIWSEVHNVKYSQPVHLHFSPKVEGTVITAYNAGHSLGGSSWKISDGIDNIVVAFDWNHARDAHLSGAFLEPKTGTVVSDLQKPSILITSTNVNSGLPSTKTRQNFLECIEAATSKGGTVSIPTSSGSRVLESMLILDKQASTGKLQVPLIYLSYHGKQTMMQASSMLEWMVPSIISDWQLQNESPFDTKNVQYVTDPTILKEKWPQKNKIIIADGEALESGLSKEIFVDLVAGDGTSSVILTEICPENTLGHMLLAASEQNNTLSEISTTLPTVSLNVREYSKGAALSKYKKAQEEVLKNATEEVEQTRRNKELIDASAKAEAAESSDSEKEEEEEQIVTEGPFILLSKSKVYDYRCSNTEKRNNRIFPFFVKKRKIDDYGLFIPNDLFSVKKYAKNEKDNKDELLEIHVSKSKDDAQRHNEATREDIDDMEADMKELNVWEPADDERPMKLTIKKRHNFKVNCWLAYADMNGLSNLRSLQMILKQVQPSKVIALPGEDSVIDYLEKAMPKFAVATADVVFQRTDFSVDVRLDPTMKVEWHNLYGGYSIARVSGKLEFDPHDQIKRFGATLVASSNEDIEVDSKTTRTTIGDLKSTSLRKMLMEGGMKAEFRGQGVLVCNDKVIVKKSDNGAYNLEGGLEPDYYVVRDAIRRFVTNI